MGIFLHTRKATVGEEAPAKITYDRQRVYRIAMSIPRRVLLSPIKEKRHGEACERPAQMNVAWS